MESNSTPKGTQVDENTKMGAASLPGVGYSFTTSTTYADGSLLLDIVSVSLGFIKKYE